MPQAAMMRLPCVQRIRRLQDGAVAFVRLNLAGDGRDDPVADLVEHEKRVVWLLVEDLRPDDPGGPRLGQFDAHGEAFAMAPHGPADNIADVQHPTGLFGTDVPLMQSEHRPLCNDEQASQLGEPSDHVVRESVGRSAAHTRRSGLVDKRHHRYGRAARCSDGDVVRAAACCCRQRGSDGSDTRCTGLRFGRPPCVANGHAIKALVFEQPDGCRRIREGEEHLAATVRLFENEGLDCMPVRDAWRSAKSQAGASSVRAVAASLTAAASSGPDNVPIAAPRRASIAVMPFVDQSTATGVRGGTADALAHDVITRLAQLRSLFVIAQGTVFALHERHIGAEEAGRMLNVGYVVSGSVRSHGKRLTVSVELAETRTARIVWAEIFNQKPDDAFLVLDEIGNRIVASIAGEIETNERNRAILKPPNSLDAWESHHRGLWHMYLFNKSDNELARHFFQKAVQLDPTFARAYAGLSFTHFQNVFQGWANRDPENDRAFEADGQSLIVH